VGPPGVGKTSLGKSVAESLGREFFRFSLGGMRDEAEIKGHRRTYIGAMPGKILQGLKRTGTNNPVIMLDEIDKLGQSHQGDPSSALLEVLDPEQNAAFLDHYLDVAFDLSKVMFIATANNLSTIPAPLLDRMEVIEIPGYTLEEKEHIATEHVIPRSLDKHGLKANALRVPRPALRKILRDYAREPGVRSFQQQMDRISRRVARLSVEKKQKLPVTIQEAELEKWLGPQRFYNEMAERSTHPGVVTGLAWTAAGGDILFIEAIALQGKGELKLTGKMGDVMVESAKIALAHVRKYLSETKQKLPALAPAEDGSFAMLDSVDWFQKHDIHLHIPAGAVPKDGPSAGITMATALLSLLTRRLAKDRVAMTGELSLVGKVLPVGGIKEKVLAAKRAGIRTLILPKLNEKDLHEIQPEHLDGLQFHFVKQVEEVFGLAIADGAQEKPAAKSLKLAKEIAKPNRKLKKAPATKAPPAKLKKKRSGAGKYHKPTP
jgi:ATP-dependent Lon protease